MAKNENVYIGFPFLTNIDEFVQNELANRAGERIRAITPFVRAVPGFIPEDGKTARVVLQGIESPIGKNTSINQFNELYRPDRYFRPLAGIKSINVDFKNKFGSIRKATIQWVCHTTEDLENLSQYFLNPGYTLLLEWGWSKASGELFNINDDSIGLATYLPEVRKKIKRSNGNYDAMLGIIINYNWTLNRDGGYDCTTEILSSGILMEGITIPEQKTIEIEKENNINTPVSLLSSHLESTFYSDIQKDLSDYGTVKENSDYLIVGKNANFGKIGESVKMLKSGDATKQNEAGEFLKEELKKNPVYLSWGYIEDKVINPRIVIQSMEGDNKKLLAYNNVGIKIGHHKFLRSCDLSVCIVPEKNIGKSGAGHPTSIDLFKFDNGEFENTENKGLRFGYLRRLLINAEFFRQTMLNSTNLNDGILNIFSKVNDACGSFWDFITINREFSYEESETLNADGTDPNKNKKVTEGTDAIFKYSIVDVNYSDNVMEINTKENPVYVFRTRSFELHSAIDKRSTSVIKNVSLSSNLSNAAALNVFYSAQSGDSVIHGLPSSNIYHSLFKAKKTKQDDTAQKYSAISAELNKRDVYASGPYITPYEGNAIKDTESEEVSRLAEDNGINGSRLLTDHQGYPTNLLTYLPLYSKGWNAGHVNIKFSTNKDGNSNDGTPRALSGRQGMKMAVLRNEGPGKQQKSVKSCAAVIPVNCEVEVEGISGIRIGDVFTVDALPALYKERGFFQCIGIVHEINKDSWTTKIKGGFRINRDSDDVSTTTSTSVFYTKTPNNNTVTNVSGDSPYVQQYMTSRQLSSTMNDRIVQAMRHLMRSHGFSPNQAAALVGNFVGESNLNPYALAKNDAGVGKHSFGIAQWNRERLMGLQNAFPVTKNEETDFNNQLKYVSIELNSTENGVSRLLKKATTFEECAMAAARYERFQGYDKYKSNSNWNTRLSTQEMIIKDKLY